MNNFQLIEQIKNMAAKCIVFCATDYNQNDRDDDGPFINLATAQPGVGLLEGFSIEHRFYDFFAGDLEELLPYKAGDDAESVIFDAIVDSHVLPMSGVEVMERALGLHKSCYEAVLNADSEEQDTSSFVQSILEEIPQFGSLV